MSPSKEFERGQQTFTCLMRLVSTSISVFSPPWSIEFCRHKIQIQVHACLYHICYHIIEGKKMISLTMKPDQVNIEVLSTHRNEKEKEAM